MNPDTLSGEQLRHAAAIADGAVDVASFDPRHLFLREARVMEKWGTRYVVSVKMPHKIAGLTVWMTADGLCPFEACMRAYLKSRR